MSLARLVITAVVLEDRRPIDVATEYGVSKGWVSKLVARYHAPPVDKGSIVCNNADGANIQSLRQGDESTGDHP